MTERARASRERMGRGRAAPESQPGGPIVAASWAGTAVLAVACALAVVSHAGRGLATVVSLLLFAAGVVAFAVALVTAAARSRTHAIGMGGLFFLQGSAPATVRRWLLGSLIAQVVVSVAAASARPYTTLAFAVLAPTYGLGLIGVWAARHGTFGPRS